MNVELSFSPIRGKRFKAVFFETSSGKKKKTTHFGSSEHDNYTIHKDPERKRKYIERHSKNENWDDITTAGALSRWLLWNETTLKKSIKDVESRFNVKFTKLPPII